MCTQKQQMLFLLTVFLMFFRVDFCNAGPRKSKTPARVLAERTGAAHFEEVYEKIPSSEENPHHIRKRASDEDDFDYEVYQGVVGRPGIDFPILPRIPQTTFSCRTFGNGYFADLETECQVFHICDDGRKISFLCPNGTIFQQNELICDWWFKVNCASSPGFYSESSELFSRSQNRKSRPSHKKFRKNQYYNNDDDEYENDRRPSPKIKTEYSPTKSYRKHYTDDDETNIPLNQKKKDKRPFDSDERQSLESFDFEDITETGIPLTNKQEKIISRVDSNDAEMQDFAESASFIGNNGQRRNGYMYNNPENKDKKDESKERNRLKNFEKSKTGDRGHHRYHNENFSKGSKVRDNERIRDSSHEYNSRRQEQRKQANDKKQSSINQSEDRETTQQATTRSRPSTYTTARRLDITKTTAYYTPTVPTLSNKPTPPNGSKTDDELMRREKQQSSEEKYSIKPVVDTQTSAPNLLSNEKAKPATYKLSLSTSIRNAETTTFSPPHRTTEPNSFGRKTSVQYRDNTTTIGSSLLPQTTHSTFTAQSKHYTPQDGFSGPTASTQFNSNVRTTPFLPSSTVSRLGTQNLVISKTKEDKTATITTTPKPFVTGSRSSEDNKLNNDSHSPHVTVLSDGSYPKSSSDRRVNALSNSKVVFQFPVSSTFKTVTSTTIKPTISTRRSTYLPEQTTLLHSSSSGPAYLPKPTKSSGTKSSDIQEHVKDMVKTLNELKKEFESDTTNKFSGKSRPGLDIPPSSGPETLHSLALYFASESENKTHSNITNGLSKSSENAVNLSTSLLTNKTVKGYTKLFGLDTTEQPTEPTLAPDFKPNIAPDTNDLDAQQSTGILGDSAGKPETRKIAKVFSNALTAYLDDPDTFRRTLAEVRPTEPSIGNDDTTTTTTSDQLFNKGTAASYLPTASTTISPTTTTEDLEDLDYSDGKFGIDRKSYVTPSTEIPITTEEHGPISSNNVDKTPASRFITQPTGKSEIRFNKDDQETTTTEANEIAMEINHGLSNSSPTPIYFDSNRQSKRIDFTSSGNSLSATPNPPLTFDLVPPIASKGALNPDILPHPLDEDEESLQRAHSQSFAMSRNKIQNDQKSSQSTTARPGNYIRSTTSYPQNNKYSPNPWTSFTSVFLDPLTINDGLMEDMKTTTASPFTYLPKATSTTTEASPIYFNLGTILQPPNGNIYVKPFTDIPEDLLPPKDGMQKLANKMFGGLNETSADHLMNVMKKAESNQTVRRLILLLIQTCDEDYSRTVEQSRKALLNALIGMDGKLAIEDEIEIIKLKPNRHSKSRKSISSENSNGLNELVHSSTTEIPVTTYRRLNTSRLYSTTPAYSWTTTLEPLSTTTHNSGEETTRFEIRVEDNEDHHQTSTISPNSEESTLSSTTETQYTTTISSNRLQHSNSSSSSSSSKTESLLKSQSSHSLSGRSHRKAKHLETSLNQSSNSVDNLYRHKNSDERALELLKSLYSLASKFGRRR